MTNLCLSDQQLRIVYAALHELETRLNRGLANSGIDKGTLRALSSPSRIHESYVSELTRHVLLQVGDLL